MVASWDHAAPSDYYRGHCTYYLGGVEPRGRWYAPAGDFGLIDGVEVDGDKFERLYFGISDDGASLISSSRGRAVDRDPAYDIVFSAPKSVSLIWAFAPDELQKAIEQALNRSARLALTVLEQEGTFARRGRGGERLEPVALSAALFQHGDSRPDEHADGRVFGDPNLHVHAVCLNLATREDGTVGALYSIAQRNMKMCLGAFMHASLAHDLLALGFEIDRIGHNGTFEVKGVDATLCEYFSVRRNEIEDELKKHNVVSAIAGAFAGAVAKATRGNKNYASSLNRESICAEAASTLGVDVSSFAEKLRDPNRSLDLDAAERLLAKRLAELPRTLTANEAVIDRKEFLRAVAAALVGTGLPPERVQVEADKLLAAGAIVEIGADRADRPRYSTPELVRIERETVEFAGRLTQERDFELSPTRIREVCHRDGLNEEQTSAALNTTKGGAISVIAGVAGSGKTTTLRAIVAGYRADGRRVLGAATAWRVANALRDDLSIPSRAIASWQEKLRRGGEFLRRGDVLIVDEAGLLGARDTHALLSHAIEAGAKVVLVGENRQLSPIEAGSGLDLCARALDAVRVEKIVRQREAWAREAILAFRDGKAGAALDAFAIRGKLVEAQGAGAAVAQVVAAWRDARSTDKTKEPLLLCRTNADVAAISRAAREVLRGEGEIVGNEIEFSTVTPSGQSSKTSLARGDRIRFLVHNDRLGVINGTTATIVAVEERDRAGQDDAQDSDAGAIHADVEGRRIKFSPKDVADSRGRARIGWAYASTIYQAQGVTTDCAVALVDASYDRRQIYVAASRAREDTLFVVDARAIDRRLAADLPRDRRNRDPAFSGEERRAWLARRLSQARSKESTLDAMDAARAVVDKGPRREQATRTDPARENRAPSRDQSRELSLD